MEHPEYTPEDELNADEFAQQVARDPAAALHQFRELQNQARYAANATPSPSVPSVPTPPVCAPLDLQAMATMIAQAVAQTFQNQPQPTPPVVPASAPLQATASATHRSEKLPDTPEYDGERDRLDA